MKSENRKPLGVLRPIVPCLTREIAGRPLWWHGSVALNIFVFIVSFVYFGITTSGAYEAAERYVRQHAEIIASVGNIQSTRLGLGTSRITRSTSHSTARFVMVVHGERGKCVVAFVVSRLGEDFEWSVDEAVYRGPEGARDLVRRKGSGETSGPSGALTLTRLAGGIR
jgi:hypothetical protein